MQNELHDSMILYLDYSIENLKFSCIYMFKVSEVYIMSGVNTQKNRPQNNKYSTVNQAILRYRSTANARWDQYDELFGELLANFNELYLWGKVREL